MKLKVLSLACLAMLSTAATAAQELSAADIVAKNVAARGGLQAWRGVTTLTMAGQLDAGGKTDARLPFVLSMKRPHKSRLEIKFQGKDAVQVYDGKQGWKVRPFLNRDEVEPYTASEVKSAATWQELDGALIDHAAKGTKVELAGKETVEGRDTYKLKLTQTGGQQRYLWVDAKTFLETKIDGEPRLLDKRPHKVAVFYRDYKTVDGLAVPHTLETVVDGVSQTHKISIENVAVNRPLDDMLFAKPKVMLASAAGAPAKTK